MIILVIKILLIIRKGIMFGLARDFKQETKLDSMMRGLGRNRTCDYTVISDGFCR